MCIDHKGFYFFSEKPEEIGLLNKLKEAVDKNKGYWVYKKINDQYSLLENQPFKSFSLFFYQSKKTICNNHRKTFLTMVLRNTPLNGTRNYSTNPNPTEFELASVKTYNADLEKNQNNKRK